MADLNIKIDNKRITNLRNYMFNILDELLTSTDYELNANFLSKDINNYSLDKIPIENKIVEEFITGHRVYREVYEFRSRNAYGEDIMTNLQQAGFYEVFEDKIENNNDEGIVPEGMTEIHCLGVGALNIANTNNCEFSCQIEIRWEEK